MFLNILELHISHLNLKIPFNITFLVAPNFNVSSNFPYMYTDSQSINDYLEIVIASPSVDRKGHSILVEAECRIRNW